MIKSVINSMKNLYRDGKITKETIEKMTSLTKEEKQDILSVVKEG